MLTDRKSGVLIALLTLPLVALAGFAVGGEDDKSEVEDGLDVWFRDADLEAMSSPPVTTYIEAAAGESTLLERAWTTAPPSIPHTTEDMLPILLDENECVECHHPDNTTSKKDKPLPDSHFQRPLLGAGPEGDPMAWKVTGYEAGDDLFGARWNCVMCHTPQAENVNTPATTFISLVAAPEPTPAAVEGKKNKQNKKKSKKRR